MIPIHHFLLIFSLWISSLGVCATVVLPEHPPCPWGAFAPSGPVRDPISQWLIWEQANLPIYQESTASFPLKMVRVSRDKVKIQAMGTSAKPLFQELNRGFELELPQHPYNQDSTVPFLNEASAEKTIEARFTASRSLVFELPDGRLYSIKLPTDHPHRSEKQEEKADLKGVIKDAVPLSRHIARMDKKLGPPANVVVLQEVLAISDKKTGNGLVVRDLTPLKESGNYYLPAFALGTAGRQIAQHNGIDFMKFVEEYYVRALGRAKAELLLRYGIQMVTPHPQNILIELDPQLKPTGRIVLRDLVDSTVHTSIADAIVASKLSSVRVRTNRDERDTVMDSAQHSLIQRGEEGIVLPLFPAEPIKGKPPADYKPNGWIAEHQEAFIEETERLLGMKIVPDSIPKFIKKETEYYDENGFIDFTPLDWYNQKRWEAFTSFMSSEEGKTAIRRYYSRFAK